jgi:hypothetical protein
MLGGNSPACSAAGIGQVGIAAKQAIDHRADEAPFEQARGPWLFQRQRREQGELDRTVGGGACIQRVDDMVGFAKPERQADHEVGADIADDIFRDRFGVGKQLWHQLRTRGKTGEPTAPNRTPASEAIAHLPSNFVCDEPATAKR